MKISDLPHTVNNGTSLIAVLLAQQEKSKTRKIPYLVPVMQAFQWGYNVWEKKSYSKFYAWQGLMVRLWLSPVGNM